VTQVWDTADRSPADQLGYWADVVCQAFTPLSPARTRAHLERSTVSAGLYGWVRSARLAAINSAEIASCTQRLTHGMREVTRAPSEEVFVNLQLSGICRGEQDERQCVVTPGTLAVFDTTRPYVLEFEEASNGEPWHVLSFRVPREQLMRLMPPDSTFSSVTYNASAGSGAVAATLMRTLWETHEDIDAATRLALDQSCTQVIASALGAYVPSAESPGRAAIDAALKAAVVRFALDRMPHGQVHANDAARHVGVSVRKLHQLFKASDTTFGSVVRDARLQLVVRHLEDARVGTSIAEVAARCGFYDGPHLTRLFRERFGCTPSEYRERHS
jgi:AraC-like DNA-binding protein